MIKYDLTICLRTYPWITDKQKVFCDDKITLYKKSLISLVQWCGNLKVFYHVILDNCSEEYEIITNKIYFAKFLSVD